MNAYISLIPSNLHCYRCSNTCTSEGHNYITNRNDIKVCHLAAMEKVIFFKSVYMQLQYSVAVADGVEWVQNCNLCLKMSVGWSSISSNLERREGGRKIEEEGKEWHMYMYVSIFSSVSTQPLVINHTHLASGHWHICPYSKPQLHLHSVHLTFSAVITAVNVFIGSWEESGERGRERRRKKGERGREGRRERKGERGKYTCNYNRERRNKRWREKELEGAGICKYMYCTCKSSNSIDYNIGWVVVVVTHSHIFPQSSWTLAPLPAHH